MTIVGVVGHIRHDRLDEDVRPQVYFNYGQRAQDRMALAVRTHGDPAAVAASLVGAIRAVDPEQPVYDARTLDAVVDRSLAQRWLQATVLGAFATIAVVLASIGGLRGDCVRSGAAQPRVRHPARPRRAPRRNCRAGDAAGRFALRGGRCDRPHRRGRQRARVRQHALPVNALDLVSFSLATAVLLRRRARGMRAAGPPRRRRRSVRRTPRRVGTAFRPPHDAGGSSDVETGLKTGPSRDPKIQFT
jgi:hypothetical protein